MEPNLDEHEVVKFLVAKGGRCTNFELVSNFRGVLNDPHCKAEARLRFKDIINTVANVVEIQNIKYIELKPGLSPSSYSSPLSQNFQPYWRFRLSTSVVPRFPLDDQKTEFAEFVSGDFSDDSSCSSRGRATSESHILSRGLLSADDQGPRQPVYQPHPSLGRQHHSDQLPGCQHNDNQPTRYQQHGNQQQPSLGHQHRDQHTPKTKYHENYQYTSGYQHHESQPTTYPHHENQYRVNQPSPGYQYPEYQDNQTSSLKHHERYAPNMQYNKNALPVGYHGSQTSVYEQRESPGLQYQDNQLHHQQYPSPGHQHDESKHNHSSNIHHNKNQPLATYHHYEDQHRQSPSYPHHQNHPKPQPALRQAVLAPQEPNLTNCANQLYEDRNQNFRLPIVRQQWRNQSVKTQNAEQQLYEDRNQSFRSQDTGLPYRHHANNHYSRHQSWNDVEQESGQHRLSSADVPPVLPERRHSHADRQSQNPKQSLVHGVKQSSSGHRKSVPNIQRTESGITSSIASPNISIEYPAISRESLVISKESPVISRESPAISKESPVISREFSANSRESPAISRESHVPEQLFSKRMESLHGIRTPDSPRDYSSLPYESPSAYSLTDISPRGTSDLITDDLQTSANLRNVARALFRDPSRRSSYEPCPRPENINGEKKFPGLSNSFLPENRSCSNKSLDGSGSNKGHETVGLPKRPDMSSETSSPGRLLQELQGSGRLEQDLRSSGHFEQGLEGHRNLDQGSDPLLQSSLPLEKGHLEQGLALPSRSKSMDFPRTNTSSGVSSNHSGSNRTLDSESESQRTSISSHSVSMQSLDSERELSNHSTEIERDTTPPPPLPPDRTKKLPPTINDNFADTDETAESSLSAGKVRDRVQHFDDMERQQRNSKRTHSPLTPNSVANKENVARTQHLKGLGIGDDVSISVIEPKLKREWFIKSSQCDYHALSRLLKNEPKLAALKDTAMGYTALHWAAKQGDANVVKLIAGAYKVNPNVRSNGGYTAVHLATLHKHGMIVHLLVHTYGADPSLRDYSGRRADQYPTDFIKAVAGHQANTNRRPLKQRSSDPPTNAKEGGGGVSFMRIGSLNLRKSSRKSAVFASVRNRNWGSAAELRFGSHSSMRKKLHKSMISAPERIGEVDKNDSDSDSTYGFPSKKAVE